MQQISTPNLLLKYLYNETSSAEKAAIEKSIANDASLQDELNRLKEIKLRLDEQDNTIPSIASIGQILAYSKEQSLTETH